MHSHRTPQSWVAGAPCRTPTSQTRQSYKGSLLETNFESLDFVPCSFLSLSNSPPPQLPEWNYPSGRGRHNRSRYCSRSPNGKLSGRPASPAAAASSARSRRALATPQGGRAAASCWRGAWAKAGRLQFGGQRWPAVRRVVRGWPHGLLSTAGPREIETWKCWF